MYNGVSGLLSSSQALGIVSDNIANVNTIGYKRSREVFADIMGQVVPGAAASSRVGGGVRMADVQQLFNQGALLTTDGQTDLAISGEGFFAVAGNVNGRDDTFFTRGGQFQLNEDGTLVTASGLRLQGYGVTTDGSIDTRVGDLQIGNAELTPNATTEVDMVLNLNAEEPILGAGGIDPLDPATYTYSTSMTVYDSLGAARRVDLFFAKTGDNAWEYQAYIDGADVVGGTPGTPEPQPGAAVTGTLTFDGTGALTAETGGTINVNFVDGAAAAQAILFDFGTSTAEGGTGLDGSTQFADRPSSLNGLSQDGFTAGSVVGFTVAADGVITGVYDNGQQRALGQVAMATFATNEGLTRVGDNVWSDSIESGDALIGAPTSGGRGSIIQGALEQSTVDIATEFVSLIAHQRAYQANGRTITTADEMYNAAIQLKR
jgi:flagellar hook protein FlgE